MKGGKLDRRYNHFGSFMRPSYHLKHWDGMNYPEGTADHPIYYISWYAAAAYAQWAEKRLPTEAEWEKAARGGLVGKKYPWGNKLNRDYANYAGTGGRDKWDMVGPVGLFLPNGYGLYDMAGNAFEWCADEYDYYSFQKSPKHNPKGPGDVITFKDRSYLHVKSARAVRGGHCWGFGLALDPASRFGAPPGSSHYSFGFRCVQDP
jgi:formylglycine-generating enzyme required for sulfatase activity